jgi:hypothetical protein
MISTTLHPAFNSPIDTSVDGLHIDPDRLLADLVESGLPLTEIARNHGLNLCQLIAWAAQPAVRALFAAADELAHLISNHKAARARPQAIDTLVRHATALGSSPRELDLANRSARTLARMTNPTHEKSSRKQRAGPMPDEPVRPLGLMPHASCLLLFATPTTRRRG